MASTVADEKAGNETYQQGHMSQIFQQGFSFSGFERDCLYLNQEGRKFKDISGVSGIDSISDGRAVVLADFDNDGDLDVFLTTIQDQAHLLFRNNVGQNNRYLRIALQGTDSGKDAFGAVVRVKTSRGLQTRVKSGGHGFLAQHDPRLLFGLGQEKQVEWVEIRWPSGKVDRWDSIPAGSSLKVVEGSGRFQVVDERTSRLPDPLDGDQAYWHKLNFKKGDAFPRLLLRPLAAQADENFPMKPGTWYFINFWATFCGPCRKEMPELQKLEPQFRARGIQLIGATLDDAEHVAAVKSFAQNLGISYPLYLTDATTVKKVFAGEEAFIPLSVLVDEEGRAVDIFIGWTAESSRRILKLLGAAN